MAGIRSMLIVWHWSWFVVVVVVAKKKEGKVNEQNH